MVLCDVHVLMSSDFDLSLTANKGIVHGPLWVLSGPNVVPLPLPHTFVCITGQTGTTLPACNLIRGQYKYMDDLLALEATATGTGPAPFRLAHAPPKHSACC